MAWPTSLQVALKEWAIVCRALEPGRQMLLLRKGGIYEAAGEFELENREFLLFPTYLHQNLKMLKPADHAGFEPRSAEPEQVSISAAGVVTDIIAAQVARADGRDRRRARLDAAADRHAVQLPAGEPAVPAARARVPAAGAGDGREHAGVRGVQELGAAGPAGADGRRAAGAGRREVRDAAEVDCRTRQQRDVVTPTERLLPERLPDLGLHLRAAEVFAMTLPSGPISQIDGDAVHAVASPARRSSTTRRGTPAPTSGRSSAAYFSGASGSSSRLRPTMANRSSP